MSFRYDPTIDYGWSTSEQWSLFVNIAMIWGFDTNHQYYFVWTKRWKPTLEPLAKNFDRSIFYRIYKSIIIASKWHKLGRILLIWVKIQLKRKIKFKFKKRTKECSVKNRWEQIIFYIKRINLTTIGLI